MISPANVEIWEGAMRQVPRIGLGVVLCLMLLPSVIAAQGASVASIAGVVKDTSGAVLPGVTVEAASPALIEKVRSTVSDDRGEYQILSLRPGTYTVTFTLGGFSPFKREGLELRVNFTATVTAELKVGTVEETVTVSGEDPAGGHPECVPTEDNFEGPPGRRPDGEKRI